MFKEDYPLPLKNDCNFFQKIGLKTEVRPLTESDLPSEYDDSDVIPAGAEKLGQLLEKGDGMLVKFYAPWCGHVS